MSNTSVLPYPTTFTLLEVFRLLDQNFLIPKDWELQENYVQETRMDEFGSGETCTTYKYTCDDIVIIAEGGDYHDTRRWVVKVDQLFVVSFSEDRSDGLYWEIEIPELEDYIRLAIEKVAALFIKRTADANSLKAAAALATKQIKKPEYQRLVTRFVKQE